MSRKLMTLVCAAALLLTAGAATAQGPNGMPEFDTARARSMSPDARRAYQQQYKAQLEQLARQNGWQPTGRRPFTPAGGMATPRVEAIGSITYHSGALGTCCQNSFAVGNQFDTANGMSVLASGSVTMATFDLISVSGGAAFLSLYDQQAGTGANFIDSSNETGLVTGLNTVSLNLSPNTYAGSTFLLGVWQFNTDVPAVATGTMGGQGFHGMSINDIVGTAFVRPGTFNGALTATGNVLVPVELTTFSID